jgi:ElaB/YqjD/DUF883 family membrane-anchored ribosome-binding protein
MVDSPEARLLREVNGHLAEIKDRNAALGETMSPSEKSAFNQNMRDTMQNFGTLLDARLKKLVLESDRKFHDTFGNLEGFQAEQTDMLIGELDDVIMSIEQSNRLLDKQFENQFLEEKQRETELGINRETNELLEELIDKEDEVADDDAAKSEGFLKAMFGGLFAGRGLAGLLGGLKGLGKKLFFPALIALSGAEFLRGWAEAGEDASVRDKFNSGIAKTLSDLTFGLVPKEFFTNMLNEIEDEIIRMWGSFKDNWKKFVEGEISGSRFISSLLSDLTMGALSPEQIEKVGQEIADGLGDLIETLFDEILDGIIEVTVGALMDKIDEILDDPMGFLERKISEVIKRGEDAAKNAQARADELIAGGMKKEEAMIQAAEEEIIKQAPLGTQTAAKIGLKLAKKFGLTKTGEDIRREQAEERKRLREKAKAEIETRKRMQEKIDQFEADNKAELNTVKRLNQKRIEDLKPKGDVAPEPRMPDESGLFPPRNFVNAPTMNTVQQEDTSTTSDDRSLQLQQQN